MDISIQDRIQIAGRALTVIGLGRSGMAAARLAHQLGAQVFVSDSAQGEAVLANQRALKAEGIEVETGRHSRQVYAADLWIISPGVPVQADLVNQARRNRIPVVGEIEFASWYTQAPILAITGSNGKTTTAQILTAMCQTSHFQGQVGGNVGIPFADLVRSDLKKPDPRRVYILEVSSFQLETIRHFKPHISLFLNVAPDHLDRHASLQEYLQAKLNLARNQTSVDFIVPNADDPLLRDQFEGGTASVVPFSLEGPGLYSLNEAKIYDDEHAILIRLNQIALPGRHNLANLLAAATAAHLLGVPNQQIQAVMATFKGVEHRLETVATIAGVTYINDSKATNVAAVKVALDSFTEPIVLILGGKDKGGDFTQLLPHTHNKVVEVVAYGEARDKISTALGDAVRSTSVVDLKGAVERSHQRARPGEIVLLSPGCASFDEFENFEHRGKAFKRLVQDLPEKS